MPFARSYRIVGLSGTCPQASKEDDASLIESCKLLGVEPHAYLADVISRIVNGHPQTRLDDLLPWQYPVTPELQHVA